MFSYYSKIAVVVLSVTDTYKKVLYFMREYEYLLIAWIVSKFNNGKILNLGC